MIFTVFFWILEASGGRGLVRWVPLPKAPCNGINHAVITDLVAPVHV